MTNIADVFSANERLKEAFEGIFAFSIMLATLAHLMVFTLWPEMTAIDEWADTSTSTLYVEPLPDVGIPASPEPLVRPAVPVASVRVPIEATLPVVGFDRAAELPPPPPVAADVRAGRRDAFIPYTVAPEFLDLERFKRALARAYPPELRDARIGGVVVLLIHIGAGGEVLEARLAESSGYSRLDAVALDLTDRMRFAPALNRDRREPVWVSMPLEFRVRDPES